MRRLVAAIAILFAVTVPPASAATTRDAAISNLSYRPGTCAAPGAPGAISVRVGDTIRWTNCDSATHTVTADDASFSSGSLTNGQSFSKTFTRTGFFNYHCEVHSAMHGTVVVDQAAPTTSRPADPLATTTTAPTRITTTTTSPPPTTTDIRGVFGEDTTTSTPDETTTTTAVDEQAIASKDKGASGPLVLVLIAAIAAVVGGGVYAVRRMRQT